MVIRTVAEMIEAAYFEGFYASSTYNDEKLNTPEEEWPASEAKRDADRLSTAAKETTQ